MHSQRSPLAFRRLLPAAAFLLLATLASGQEANSPSLPPPTPNDTPTPSASSAPSGKTVVLSPFEVQSTQDNGYRARDTLAGSRISTNLDDLAASISVVTKEFMNDIGADNLNDILTYEAGAEGTQDFQMNQPELGRTTDNATQDPNSATRGRGLAPFDVTRDYFYSLTLGNPVFSTQAIGQSIGFDTYNLDRVTIVRGPDSVLAGLGSPAGIINYTPAQARIGDDSTDVSFRYGSYGDQRAVFNTNQSLDRDHLAVYAAGLWADYEFEQQPAYDHDKRYYTAITWKPFKGTAIRASYENAHVQERLPNTLTPEDDISQWVQLGKPTSPAPGVGPSGSPPGVYEGGANYGNNTYFNANGSVFAAYNDAESYTFYQTNLSNVPAAFWEPLRFSNNTYGDWHQINTSGTVQDMILTSEEVSLDQQILPGLEINLAGLHEIANDHQVNTSRPDFVYDSVDINQELPNGQPNPHFGETFMYFSGLDSFNQTYSTNLAGRASATYNLDLNRINRWLGRYVFTGFAESRHTEGDFIDYDVNQAGAAVNTSGGPGLIAYTGGTAANGYRAQSAPTPPELVTDAPYISATGPITDSYTTVTQLKEEYKAETKLTTAAFVFQPFLFDGMVDGLLGIRRDTDRQGYLTTAGVDPASGIVNPLPYGQYSNGPLQSAAATTKTYGVVVHGPKLRSLDLSWLSVGYNHSENFVPNAGSVDLEGNPVSNPTGTTKDWSISADLLHHQLNVKVDWYTTIAAGQPDTNVDAGVVQWEIPFLIEGYGSPTDLEGPLADIARRSGIKNFQSGLGPTITLGDPALANSYSADMEAHGMEVELTYNVTKNWRLFGSLTREEAEQSNICTQLTAFINNRVAYWNSIGLLSSPVTTTLDWSGAGPETAEQIYQRDILYYEVAYEAVDGQPSQQLHKWKAAVVTDYTFDHGWLKRLGVGTGIRWLDRTIIGNPVIMGDVNGTPTVVGLDLQHPYTTPAEASIKAWLSYTLPPIDGKYILSFRLEGDNLTSKSGYQAVSANADGTHAVFAIDPPPTCYFTTDLKF
jgi:outer membrane receptor protein involved in Fe transport